MILAAAEKRTITIPSEQARYVDRLVETGAYGSPSDVVSAGLRALQEKEAAVERWLREEVAPVYDAMEADPSRAIPADQVMAAIRARHSARLKKPKRGA
jgi:antitoxin ParD1/3/4